MYLILVASGSQGSVEYYFSGLGYIGDSNKLINFLRVCNVGQDFHNQICKFSVRLARYVLSHFVHFFKMCQELLSIVAATLLF